MSETRQQWSFRDARIKGEKILGAADLGRFSVSSGEIKINICPLRRKAKLSRSRECTYQRRLRREDTSCVGILGLSEARLHFVWWTDGPHCLLSSPIAFFGVLT